MDNLLTAARAVAALSNKPITTFEQLPDLESAFYTDSCFGELMQPLSEATPDDMNAVLDVLAPAIRSPDPYQGNRIAIVCGTIVEWGGDAWRVAEALLQRLPSQLDLASRIAPDTGDEPEVALFDRDPEGAKAWASLRFLLLATMTVFCRHLPSRIVARANPTIMNPLPMLAEHSREADFLLQSLGLTDAMEVTVLHVAEEKGWRVRLEAIRSHPHFHTLLQARLIGDPAEGLLSGEPTDSIIVALAHNDTKPTEERTDYARFECYFPGALQPDGTINGLWITSEMSPTDYYPLGDGERVLLLGPLMLGGRHWGTSFFPNIHDALRSDVEIIETLSRTQVTDRLERIKAENARNGSAS